MPIRNLFPVTSVDFVRELADEAGCKAEALSEQANAATRICQLWEALASYLQKGWPRHVIWLLDKEKVLLDSMRVDNPQAAIRLEELRRTAISQIDELQRRFPAFLQEACSADHLPLDLSSRHPRYTFEGGFFQLHIDEQKGTARLSDYEGRLDEFPADVGAVVEAVKREYQRVFGRATDPHKVLKKLRHQYLAVLRSEGQSDGASVPIRAITHRLGKNEKGFRTDEFLVDLSRLVQTGPFEIDGYRLDLQHTKDTNQGMLLHGAAGRGYIGFITFRKV